MTFNEARKELLEGLKFAYETKDGNIIFPTGADSILAIYDLYDIITDKMPYTSERRIKGK